jgi:branched-chain amino acid transport system permease protein
MRKLPTFILAVALLIPAIPPAFAINANEVMLGVPEDKEAAKIQGVKVDFVYAISFGIGTCLAALAGGFVGPIFALNPHMGAMPMMTAFMATILGGLGNIPGAVVGALIIGISESFLATYFGGAFAGIMIFVVIVIVLTVRPSGLFGERGS